MEIRFKTITLRNYKSFGNVPTTFRLDEPGCKLIVGENLDFTSEGKTSNGVGKSASLESICYALYDKTPSNISRDNLINNINKKNLEVTLVFSKDGVDYSIKRARKTTNGTYVKFLKNGKDITLDSMSRTNDLIQDVIGIPFELFVQIVSVSASNSKSFFSLPLRSGNGPSQVGMIEELFNLTTLTEKADALKESLKDTKARLENKEQKFELLKREKDRHDQQLASIRKRVDDWDKENERSMTEISRSLEKISGVNLEEQQKLYQELNETRGTLRSLIRERDGLESSIDRDLKTKKKRTVEFEHLRESKCPFCLQKMPDSDVKIKEIEEAIVELNNSITVAENRLASVETEESDVREKIKSLESALAVSDIDELIKIKTNSEPLYRRLAELKTAENPHVETLKELESVELEEIDMSELNDLSERYEHQKFLLKLLTKKDSFVRKNLLNRNIPYLNSRLSHNLKELGLTHRAEFTHELSTSISQFGNPLDFGNLSHGQQARVNLALAFAFRDVLQSLHGFINILIMDESLDVGLDNVGIYSAVKMIKKKTKSEGISTLVISHKDEITTMFEEKILIQMKNGFSIIGESYE